MRTLPNSVVDLDPSNAVLPLTDGTYVRLRDAQAVAGLLLVKATEREPQDANDEAEEIIRVLDGLENEARPPRTDDRIRAGTDGQTAFLNLIVELAEQLQQTLRVTCIECGRQLSADSNDAQLELTTDGKPIFYCTDCRPPRS